MIQMRPLPTRGCGRPPSEIAIITTISSGRGASSLEIVTVARWSNDQILSLWANGTSIDVPGPPILTLDEMIASPPPTASRIGWPRRGWSIAAPCSISPPTPTIAAFPYATAERERRLARSDMTRRPSSAPSANSGDRSSTNRSANGLSTTATATARVMGWLIGRPTSAKIVSLVKLSLRRFIALLHWYEARTGYSRSDEGWHQLFRRDGCETTVGQS